MAIRAHSINSEDGVDRIVFLDSITGRPCDISTTLFTDIEQAEAFLVWLRGHNIHPGQLNYIEAHQHAQGFAKHRASGASSAPGER